MAEYLLQMCCQMQAGRCRYENLEGYLVEKLHMCNRMLQICRGSLPALQGNVDLITRDCIL